MGKRCHSSSSGISFREFVIFDRISDIPLLEVHAVLSDVLRLLVRHRTKNAVKLIECHELFGLLSARVKILVQERDDYALIRSH
ncbi:MAG: hypothetical protein J1G30_04195, partial [Spirochaetales bacterium]|nr:hypothetical protein [Spirochaetales bacterium]